MRRLSLWQPYTREEVHGIFSPDTNFTPQTGTWGLQGIVRVPDSDGDFVFFVTFGAKQGEHAFAEEITDDGVLTWQSQPAQRLNSPVIRQLVSHDDLTNSIHLFLRTNRTDPYTYLGQLGYLDHDAGREAPVYFTWQLMDWPPPAGVLSSLGVRPITTPSSHRSVPKDTLTRTDPPVVGSRQRRGAGAGRKVAYLPGQDAKNHALGLAGEKLVLHAEQTRLHRAGRSDLAEKVEHVAVIEGDSAGYDIRSFEVSGAKRHIEVKTTKGPAANAFFLSPNEIRFGDEHPDSYVIYRVYDYSEGYNSAHYYELTGPIGDHFDLEATEYRARLRSAERPPAN